MCIPDISTFLNNVCTQEYLYVYDLSALDIKVLKVMINAYECRKKESNQKPKSTFPKKDMPHSYSMEDLVHALVLRCRLHMGWLLIQTFPKKLKGE